MEHLWFKYGSIMIEGLKDSPNFLISHLKREIKKLREQGYEEKEIKYGFESVIKSTKKALNENCRNRLADYKKYSQADKIKLPSERRNMSKPTISGIPMTSIVYPSGHHQTLLMIKRWIYWGDFIKIEKALATIFSNSEALCGINENNEVSEDLKPSKLTHLLQLYYKNSCKPLTKYQVEILATEKKITKAVLINRWIALKADRYKHNGNPNNIKQFIKSYKSLMQIFKNDSREFLNIKNHYEQLKETYPDLSY